MGTNSIKSNLTKESIISDIKLLLSADTDKKSIFIVVEGEDDVNFFKKFCKDNVIIYESYSGKNGVEEIINSEVIRDKRVVGVRDKDYCKKNTNDRIFYYDKCCMEMMILNFHEPFNSIYCEFYKGKVGVSDLKNHILLELFKLSKLRKYNEENGTGINFNGILSKCSVDSEGRLDEEKFLEKLKEINSSRPIDFQQCNIEKDYRSVPELLEITNGHDFIYFFKLLCDKEYNQKQYSDKAISTALRASFYSELFQKTVLYNNLRIYFEKNSMLWYA